jgi:hypothetical protein
MADLVLIDAGSGGHLLYRVDGFEISGDRSKWWGTHAWPAAAQPLEISAPGLRHVV